MSKDTILVRAAKILPHIERRNLAIALVVLLLLVSGMLYYFVYPRSDVQIDIWYSEGMMGSITVDVTLHNSAASILSDMEITLSLINSTGDVVAVRVYESSDVEAWERRSLPSLSVTGKDLGDNTHFDPYTIRMDMAFRIDGEAYSYTFLHETEEPYINLFFSDNIGGFIF